MLAGSHWMRGENLYANWRGFIYSPLTAAFFAPFSCLPPGIAYGLWLLANAAALLGGLAALFVKPVSWFQPKMRWYCLLASSAPCDLGI